QEVELPGPYRELANESFYLDHRGNLFLGKENGLSIIEGKHISHILMKGPVYVTGTHSDTLYYTSAGDVGLLVIREQDEVLQLSRKHWIPASQRDFIPSGILLYQNQLFINTNRGIYSFKDGTFRLQPFGAGQSVLKPIKDQLFLMLENDSILAWNGNEFNEISEYGQQILNEMPAQHVPLGTFVRSSFIDYLQHGLMLIKEERNGLSILDERGMLINRLGGKGGLPDREISQVTVRDGREIWILAPHTLHRITYPSPLKTVGIETFETGRILNSILIGDTLFAGTSHGLFQLHKEDDLVDKIAVRNLIPESNGSIHLLSESEDHLFAAGITHLYSIDGGDARMIGEGFFTGIAALGKNKLVASNRKGIVTYRKDSSGWNATMLDATLPASYSFVFHRDQLFLICNNVVYSLNEAQNMLVPASSHSEDLLHRLVSIRDNLYLI
ncbi:MAG: hypothetical protein P8100_15775, partial [bacterium]